MMANYNTPGGIPETRYWRPCPARRDCGSTFGHRPGGHQRERGRVADVATKLAASAAKDDPPGGGTAGLTPRAGPEPARPSSIPGGNGVLECLAQQAGGAGRFEPRPSPEDAHGLHDCSSGRAQAAYSALCPVPGCPWPGTVSASALSPARQFPDLPVLGYEDAADHRTAPAAAHARHSRSAAAACASTARASCRASATVRPAHPVPSQPGHCPRSTRPARRDDGRRPGRACLP